MILTARALFGEMIALRNEAEIARLKSENAFLREEVEALGSRLRDSEESHQELTARYIEEVTG